MDKVYVFGHKNPDTDSICSAISYCSFKKLLGVENCVPARLGEINKETEYILNYFNVPVPQLIESVMTQVSDIDYDKLVMIYPHVTIKQVWETMKSTQTKLLPLIESPEERKMVGVVSLGDVTKFNMETFDENALSKYNTSFFNIAEVLKAEVISGNDQLFDVVNGTIITCTNIEALSKADKNAIVVVGKGINLESALKADVKCIILADGCKVKIPRNFKGVLLSTPYSIFNIIKIISLAIPVGEIMKTEDIIYFNESDFIDDVRDIMTKWKFRNYPILDGGNNVLGTLAGRHLLNIKNKKVILVDHNEKSQSVHGLEQSHILEIIDHHRVADIQTNYPVYFRNEPVGSTGTIIGNMYLENDLMPDKKTAGLLLSSIISDTLLFKSPTCTHIDKSMAQKLAAVAELNIDEYGRNMLREGSQLEDKTPQELLFTDFKEFSFNKYHFAVAQVNTVNMNKIASIKKDILSYIRNLSKEKGYNIMALMITDVLDGGSEILYAGDSVEVMKDLFNSRSEESTGYLPGVVSRKKQVIPQIINKLSYY